MSGTTLGGGQGPVPCVVLGGGTRLPARAGPVVGGPQSRPGAGTKHSSDTGAGHWPGPGSYVGTASNSTE